MRIPNIQLLVTIRTLALIPMIAVGACAELELQENVLVPITPAVPKTSIRRP